MAANLTIDKIFADNLGTAFGGCVRDQSLNLFSPEIARSAGANWNPLFSFLPLWIHYNLNPLCVQY